MSTDDDEILAFLDDGAPEPQPKLEAVVSAIEYTVAIPSDDAAALTEQGKWEHLEGVLWRRRCSTVHTDASAEIIVFSISEGNANIDDVVQAIAEELDEITGRKLEKAGAEAWGMF